MAVVILLRLSDILLPEQLEEKLISLDMATIGKKGDNHRPGAVRASSQAFNSFTELWVKYNSETNRFMTVKQNGGSFKGIGKEYNK